MEFMTDFDLNELPVLNVRKIVVISKNLTPASPDHKYRVMLEDNGCLIQIGDTHLARITSHIKKLAALDRAMSGIRELEDLRKEIENAILVAPGGPEYQAARARFEAEYPPSETASPSEANAATAADATEVTDSTAPTEDRKRLRHE